MSTIHLLSDLHLESCIYNPPLSMLDSDIVVLAGDIDEGIAGLAWARNHFSGEIIYVAGNHEFYDHEYHALLAQLRSDAKKLKIHFLENDEVILGAVRFLGCTLWTDYRTSKAFSQSEALRELNKRIADHDYIKLNSDRSLTDSGASRFKTRDAWRIHQDSTTWLTQKLLEEPFNGITVVVTHHGPSLKCCHGKYGHTMLSGAFYSELNHLFFQQADYWFFGHTHYNIETTIDKCHLMSNQRGYRIDSLPGFKPDLQLTLPC